MNPATVDAMVDDLASVYQRADVSEETREMWRASFSATDAANVEAVVDRWVATQKWFPTPAELHGVFRELSSPVDPRVPVGTPGCNGSGWIGGDDGVVPCRRCNPFLTVVWNDKVLRRRYLAGEPIARLTTIPDGMKMPEKCLQDTVHSEPGPPIEVVREILKKARALRFDTEP